MNSHWTALNTTEFSYKIWSCPIFLPKPKRADWRMCFRLLRWIFMSLFWLVCRNLMGSYEFVLWWCGLLSLIMNSHWTALNTTEFSCQIWSCPIFLPEPKRADWLMCFRLLRWIFMSLFWLVCRNLMGSCEFVLWWSGGDRGRLQHGAWCNSGWVQICCKRYKI